MLSNLTGWHFLVILAVILLIFGAAKLPALAKSMGQSARLFKGEMRAMKGDDPHADGIDHVSTVPEAVASGNGVDSTGHSRPAP